jgi:hypothetical protein
MAAKKDAAAIPAEKLLQYNKLVMTLDGIEQKGATMPYTSVNGHMFSFLDKDGTLALRLGKEDREEFIKKYKTKLHEAHGVIMKEYVTVPDALLKKTKELEACFTKSHAYVSGLKPKPAKNKK